MSSVEADHHLLAAAILKRLASQRRTLVLAESCTAGLVAATLAGIPGASAVLAGSWVVYQTPSKTEWLELEESQLERYGPVSEPVTRLLASAALQRTPHADLALAITGNLGPAVQSDADGVLFIAVLVRGKRPVCRRTNLLLPPPRDTMDFVARRARMHEAVSYALAALQNL